MQKRIEGVAVFGKDGFEFFDSGLPEVEPVLEEGVGHRRGTITVEQNASVVFVPDPARTIIPPSFDDVLRDNNLIVKRTSRNFIVTMKFPIIEEASVTTDAHKEMWNKTRKAITAAREEIKKTF